MKIKSVYEKTLQKLHVSKARKLSLQLGIVIETNFDLAIAK